MTQERQYCCHQRSTIKRLPTSNWTTEWAVILTSGGNLLFTHPINACLGVVFVASPSKSSSIIGMLIWYFKIRVHIRPKINFRFPFHMSVASKVKIWLKKVKWVYSLLFKVKSIHGFYLIFWSPLSWRLTCIAVTPVTRLKSLCTPEEPPLKWQINVSPTFVRYTKVMKIVACLKSIKWYVSFNYMSCISWYYNSKKQKTSSLRVKTLHKKQNTSKKKVFLLCIIWFEL